MDIKRKSGQAMVEMAIGLIAIITVVGGMVQLGRLGIARMETRVLATERATALSMMPADDTGVFHPPYVRRVFSGNDGYSYSQDDVRQTRDWQGVDDRLAQRLRPDLAGVYAPGSPIAAFTSPDDISANLGLVRGSGYRFNIPVLPVVRHLIFNEDSIDIQTDVWMPRTGDLY